ncbi:MAG: DUF1499 domain-containing protein [Bacteroidota bacterium]
MRKWGLRVLAVLLIVFLIRIIVLASQSKHIDPHIGYVNQEQAINISTSMERKLKACPSSPNCVSTQTDQAKKLMAPLSFEGASGDAQERLKAMVLDMPRTKLISEEPGYMHFAFTTWPIPFVDDVEFLFSSEEKAIHFRSASRVGHSDLGVNASRMKKISTKWSSLGG